MFELTPGLAVVAASHTSSFGAIAWLFWKRHQDHERMLDRLRQACLDETRELRHALAEFKLEVARGYASIGYIKDVESRLTAHLLRIEAKLDGASA
ncbi:MAG: hypothetical protein HY059_04840 [Proteobacteria bacterium]|nr:hypothetical protein [Pseudomonadota bacterium]